MQSHTIATEAIRRGAIQKVEEFAELLDRVRTAPFKVRNIVEIGAALGGTLYGWRTICPDAKIIAVDLPSQAFGIEGSESHLRRAAEELRVKLLLEDSRAPRTVATVLDLLYPSGQIDVLFIDGDHTEAGIASDFWAYSPLVALGGFIVFHDIRLHEEPNVGVSRFWKSLKTEPMATHEIVAGPEAWGGIGILCWPGPGAFLRCHFAGGWRGFMPSP